MLITFSSDVSPDVVLFGEVATLFLHAMGESDKPPGILRGDNIRLATERLQNWLGSIPAERTADDAGEDGETTATDEEKRERQNRIGLKKRAFPLLELLDIAYKRQSDVIWR